MVRLIMATGLEMDESVSISRTQGRLSFSIWPVRMGQSVESYSPAKCSAREAINSRRTQNFQIPLPSSPVCPAMWRNRKSLQGDNQDAPHAITQADTAKARLASRTEI